MMLLLLLLLLMFWLKLTGCADCGCANYCSEGCLQHHSLNAAAAAAAAVAVAVPRVLNAVDGVR
jgi:hypothetical protein